MKDIIVKLFLYAVVIWWFVMSGLCFSIGNYAVASIFLIIGLGMLVYFIYEYIIKYIRTKDNKQ